jgi:hypothetical protein
VGHAGRSTAAPQLGRIASVTAANGCPAREAGGDRRLSLACDIRNSGHDGAPTPNGPNCTDGKPGRPGTVSMSRTLFPSEPHPYESPISVGENFRSVVSHLIVYAVSYRPQLAVAVESQAAAAAIPLAGREMGIVLCDRGPTTRCTKVHAVAADSRRLPLLPSASAAHARGAGL